MRKELVIICKVVFVFFTVLRSESIEMLMAQRLPAEENSIKEQLKALCVKLLSLVSYHRSFNFQLRSIELCYASFRYATLR